MMWRSMTMKCIGLLLILSIISHSFANSLRNKEVADEIQNLEKELKELKLEADINDDVQKEVKTVDADAMNVPSPASDEAKKEKIPSFVEVNQKAKTYLVTHQVELQEGDELLTAEQIAIEKYDNDPNLAKDARVSAAARWPKTGDRVKVPYVIASAVSSNTRKMNAIQAAIAKYSELSCIDWEPAANTAQHHVRFINDRGCYSYIGRVTRLQDYQGFQPISIGNGCGYLGTVEHEMLHCLGFFHEQSRPDRDDFVRVILENLADPSFANNFQKQGAAAVDSAGQPYDLDSVMHYASYYFAKPGKNTMVLRSNGQPFDANREGFSKIDLLQLNAIYGCTKPTTTPTPGPNPGVNPGPAADTKTCETFVKVGLCGYTYVCDLCKSQCTAPTNPTALILDIEGEARCEVWKNKGFCTSERYASWMAKFCMKTCLETSFPRDGTCQ